MANLKLVWSRLFSSADPQTAAKKTAASSIYEGRAVVTERIAPGQQGRVSFQGTTWQAICPYHAELPPNTPVRVLGFYTSTTLIVEPVLLVDSYAYPFSHAA